MNIEFLSTLAVIAPDPAASRKLYVDTLGLPLESHGDDYHHSEHIAGCKSFGIWPLSQAAEACFGTSQWPAERPVPQVSIEFDVADAAAVTPAARELEQAGYELLHPPARGAVGSDRSQAAVTGGRDRRDLVRPCAPRPALTEGRDNRVAVRRRVGEDELRSAPTSAEQPTRLGSLRTPADVIYASAAQESPSSRDDLVNESAGHVARVAEDPAHVVIRPGDEPVERHDRMDEDVAHHHLRDRCSQQDHRQPPNSSVQPKPGAHSSAPCGPLPRET